MNRGEVWFINLNPTIGREIKKVRPVVIVNDDSIGILPLKVIVPITGWKEHYNVAPWMIKIEPTEENGLDKVSAIDTFQIRSVSEKRFINKIGEVPDSIMKEIEKGLSIVLSID